MDQGAVDVRAKGDAEAGNAVEEHAHAGAVAGHRGRLVLLAGRVQIRSGGQGVDRGADQPGVPGDQCRRRSPDGTTLAIGGNGGTGSTSAEPCRIDPALHPGHAHLYRALVGGGDPARDLTKKRAGP